MATLAVLVDQKILREELCDLEDWEMPERHLYCAKGLDVWTQTVLEPATRVRGRNLHPHEQVDQLFYDYVMGNPMTYSVGYRKLEPLGQHIWEFKTEDVRIFGWFIKKRHFVATHGEFKDRLSSQKMKLSTSKLYKPFVEGACIYRENLDLDPPKLIPGLNYNDIL